MCFTKVVTKRVQISEKIKEDWVTLVNFAKKNDLSHGSLDQVLNGSAKSTPVYNKLLELGYIKSADDLPDFTGRKNKKPYIGGTSCK